jgi:hypothetical protein
VSGGAWLDEDARPRSRRASLGGCCACEGGGVGVWGEGLGEGWRGLHYWINR